MNGLENLIKVVQQLRDKDKGCPWHLEQTPQTIAPYSIEEVYELYDALLKKDTANTKEEIGDLLFHLILYCQHAAEAGEFTLDDVAQAAADKIKQRKPHVFGDITREEWQNNSAYRWDNLKRQGKTEDTSILAGVPDSMPALAAAHEIQKRAIRAGFMWPDIDSFFNKIDEELAEIKEAAKTMDSDEHFTEELGDVLFTIAILGWYRKTSPEMALRGTNRKFKRRFSYVERAMAREGLPLCYDNMDKMDAYWAEAKALEKKGQLDEALSA